ncbi:thioesterase family protein [Pseudomonas turukhanskensis]|uniref:Carnitine dehydrogenase n=1 Tax=Pseudomonas turukhanskensis TaxID=1806536 RepID=A0A9W6JZZ9_9PSED|nr:thioesterase family protein [Pseudomonas turukhanskensis]GLK86985.1 carnitine dehydrogenase [Pseudomonas turukhanskensis]
MPPRIYQTRVSADWVDYNGHLRDAYYLLIFSQAVDTLMDQIGLDAAGRAASGHSLFTLEAHINYLHEVKQDEPVDVRLHILGHDRKRLHLYLSLHREGREEAVAVSEQMLLHVDMSGPKSAPFSATTAARIAGLVKAQGELPKPEYAGRVMALPG